MSGSTDSTPNARLACRTSATAAGLTGSTCNLLNFGMIASPLQSSTLWEGKAYRGLSSVSSHFECRAAWAIAESFASQPLVAVGWRLRLCPALE